MPYTEQAINMLKLQRRIFLALNTCAAIAVAVLVYLFVQTDHRVNGQTKEIQKQRAESIMRGCKDQNMRHDHTFVVIKQILIRQIESGKLATPAGKKLFKEKGTNLTFPQIVSSVPKAQQARVSQSVSLTLLLIDALAPKQNCDKLADVAVSST